MESFLQIYKIFHKIDWLRICFFEQNKVHYHLHNYLEVAHGQKNVINIYNHMSLIYIITLIIYIYIYIYIYMIKVDEE